MRIAICGSMTFSKEMLDVKASLEAAGHVVRVPHGAESYASGEKLVEDKWEKLEHDVIKRWYHVICDSDAVVVLNHDKNGVVGYVGGNSLIEMAFAHVHEKKIFLWKQIPMVLSYADEIEAFKPIVIDGDLSLVV